jgi:2-polyprenyl-3-methyl-5-hydroxy-6-metoxy-1,4-benzoquinol methylase
MIENWYAAFIQSVGETEDKCAYSQNYFLKPGYTSRQELKYFVTDDDGVVHQPDVYALAALCALKLGASCLIDVGCGNAQKLIDCAGELDTIGIDFGTNLKLCQKKYPIREWVACDLDKDHLLPLSSSDLALSVLICADVIEHLLHPEHLLKSLRAAREHCRLLIITTPERDLLRGIQDMGPPANESHIREWNMAEFGQLLDYYGLVPQRIGLTRSNVLTGKIHTIMAMI